MRTVTEGSGLAVELEDGGRCTVWADARARQWVGRPVTVVYSRTDADGTLREPRLLESPTARTALNPRPDRAALL